MKKHEIIGLFVLMIISTIYSLNLPEAEVKQITSNPQIKIVVEGKYNQTLTFDKAPTVEAVFKQLNIKNIYGFDDKTVLPTRTVFYIPEGENLISLNKATKEQLMTIKGIGVKTADKIIEYRQKTPFCTIEDITKISGIGQKTYLRIRGLLCL
ncbi:competence protein ComEA [Thomasclavelia cocleata]|jgi:competence protein ComEA|uniref:ComE operon protein 1 n=1 Tax=Thomasclavelia cocleata TaxID=69824 RepID=A0A1I0FEG4_9FIRM|nr:helix-hairpin-helix domain-containing protein [Thomasclavelia cocleata]MCI9631305.1 helix-hairpin-helix domain-containing protein [Thomasclavelia cocleata]MCR1960563.1 helix-hairpin-helix domain-containing protein [Thomasclavelia cocleata]NDO41528.1 helix-hairpin-helix domain-containing protein [Thomasclavelia cocleata]PJN81736.1 competence protein ComEA [Thomasclavelia cocleata]SET56371.1 Helix-hairpin-helix motif-containing protein [Thomasclavelia cocleata]